MTDLLRKLLDIRDALNDAREIARGYGLEALDQDFDRIDALQRRIVVKVNIWDAPSKPPRKSK